MRPPLTFFVPGIPATAGSKRLVRFGARFGITEDCKRSKPWRASVQGFAVDGMRGNPGLWEGPLEVSFLFSVTRPLGHVGRKGLKPSAPEFPAKKPDLLKFARAVEDALTGVVWRDDAQIVTEHLHKRYGADPGVWITVREASSETALAQAA